MDSDDALLFGVVDSAMVAAAALGAVESLLHFVAGRAQEGAHDVCGWFSKLL